ncbi:hypothetical protein GCM10010321_00070 [Streptomyces chartreusis]|nr:hypothetical protein GCM10010321_00070 [Streptomyces chartreusis]
MQRESSKPWEAVAVGALQLASREQASGLRVSSPGGGHQLRHLRTAENDVIVEATPPDPPGELDWPSTWTDRDSRDRTPSVRSRELSGVATELGYGTTGLTIGQRWFGLNHCNRDGWPPSPLVRC